MIVKTKYFGVFRIDDILRISPFVVEKYTEGKKHIGFTVSYRSQPDYGWYRIIEDAALTIEKRRQDYENFVDAVCNASQPEMSAQEISRMLHHGDPNEWRDLVNNGMVCQYGYPSAIKTNNEGHPLPIKTDSEGLANLAKHTNEM